MTLSFAEMLLSREGLEEWSYFTPGNVSAQFELRGVSALAHTVLLDPGHSGDAHHRKGAEFSGVLGSRPRRTTRRPSRPRRVDEWISHLEAPGGLRGVLETYRAGLERQHKQRAQAEEDLGAGPYGRGAEFFGNLVEDQMRKVAEAVERSEVFEGCGHSVALEAEDRLADLLREFMLDEALDAGRRDDVAGSGVQENLRGGGPRLPASLPARPRRSGLRVVSRSS